jgi:hypothetical protein
MDAPGAPDRAPVRGPPRARARPARWILLGSMRAAVRDPTRTTATTSATCRAVGTSGLRGDPGLFERVERDAEELDLPAAFARRVHRGLRRCGADLRRDVESLQHLSLASHLLPVRRELPLRAPHFGEVRALWIAILLGFSTLLMGLSRLALTDSFIALCMTTTSGSSTELTGAGRRAALRGGIPFIVRARAHGAREGALRPPRRARSRCSSSTSASCAGSRTTSPLRALVRVPGAATLASSSSPPAEASPAARDLVDRPRVPADAGYAIRAGSGRGSARSSTTCCSRRSRRSSRSAGSRSRPRATAPAVYDPLTFFLGLIVVVARLPLQLLHEERPLRRRPRAPIRVFGVLMLGELAGHERPFRRARLVTGLLVALLVRPRVDAASTSSGSAPRVRPVTNFLAITRGSCPSGAS